MPANTGKRRPPQRPASAKWIIDPQTPFYCEVCKASHPIIEHRDCRAGGAS